MNSFKAVETSLHVQLLLLLSALGNGERCFLTLVQWNNSIFYLILG